VVSREEEVVRKIVPPLLKLRRAGVRKKLRRGRSLFAHRGTEFTE